MKVEGQWVFGWATGQYQRSARVNRQLQGRAAWLSTFALFVIGGFIGSSILVVVHYTNVRSACFNAHTLCLVLLFISGLLIHSKIRLNDHPSETLFALTYELTNGRPGRAPCQPGRLHCLRPSPCRHRALQSQLLPLLPRCARCVGLANWQLRNSKP